MVKATLPGDLPEIEAMRLGTDYSFSVALRKFSLSLRPLANSEFTQAYAAVTSYMRGIPEGQKTKITEDNALAREFLKMASSPFIGAPNGQLTDAILDRMTNDEIMFFYKEWQAVCDKVNPNLDVMKKEDIESLVEHIKKNRPKDLDFQLTELSFGQMRNILQYLLTNGD